MRDDAQKFMRDDGDKCVCGHLYSWHDENERCRHEDCGCPRFDELEGDDFDDLDFDE